MRLISLLKCAALLAAATLALTACGPGKETGMRVYTAELSEEEIAIVSLLGGDSYHIYDYAADQELRSVKVNFYVLGPELTWQCTGGADGAVEHSSGRFAVCGFKEEGRGPRVAIQDENGFSSWQTTADTPPQEEVYSTQSTVWATTAPLVYEKEIPLSVQIASDGKAIRSSPDSFNHPEDLGGYKYVRAVTVTFSTSPL